MSAILISPIIFILAIYLRYRLFWASEQGILKYWILNFSIPCSEHSAAGQACMLAGTHAGTLSLEQSNVARPASCLWTTNNLIANITTRYRRYHHLILPISPNIADNTQYRRYGWYRRYYRRYLGNNSITLITATWMSPIKISPIFTLGRYIAHARPTWPCFK